MKEADIIDFKTRKKIGPIALDYTDKTVVKIIMYHRWDRDMMYAFNRTGAVVDSIDWKTYKKAREDRNVPDAFDNEVPIEIMNDDD